MFSSVFQTNEEKQRLKREIRLAAERNLRNSASGDNVTAEFMKVREERLGKSESRGMSKP